MKRLFILLIALFTMMSCHRATCPAYMDGASTGTGGSNEKPQQLFPKKIKKH